MSLFPHAGSANAADASARPSDLGLAASGTPSDVVVVTAADDRYALPLAVTVRSALDRLGATRRLQLYVLDGGVSAESKRRLEASWRDPRLTLHWMTPSLDLVRDLVVSEHVNIVTYLRLLMPAVLPESVTRAIYMDADMLVCRDLGALWDEPQGGHAVLAVADVAAPYLDSATALPTYDRCCRHLAAITPIVNFRELGLRGDAKYFNGGLLVADIAQWRREGLAQRMLACLREHRSHVLWWDQYALNVVLADQWRELDARWNQGAHLFVFPSWRESPLERAAYNRLRNDPWIVHFCSPSKPWHYFCRHPFTSEFRRCAATTAWADWRPERPPRFASKWWDFHYQPLRSQWKTHVRAAKRALGYRRRAA